LNPTSDHRALELGERAGYLLEQPACRGRRINVLLIQVEIDPNRFQVLDRAKKVAERTPNPIYRPCHDEIEPTPIGVLEHPIECRALVAPLRTADPEILIDLGNRPSAPLIVGNTGDSGFVATAVGMGTHLGLTPLPPGRQPQRHRKIPERTDAEDRSI
jgi:hypothetical protein